MSNFNPPQHHWDDDFDARLIETLEWLRDRILRDEKEFRRLLNWVEESAELAEQSAKDAKFWADKARGDA